MSTFIELTDAIKGVVKSGRVLVNRKHITTERAYREISIKEVEEVLRQGKVCGTAADMCIEWQHKYLGRLLKLLIRAQRADGEQTINHLEIVSCVVGTAYEPRVNDSKKREQFLRENSGWELDPNCNGKGYVRTK